MRAIVTGVQTCALPISVRSADELKRIFGVSGVPEGVKKVTVV
jgi:hypothetical protein